MAEPDMAEPDMAEPDMAEPDMGGVAIDGVVMDDVIDPLVAIDSLVEPVIAAADDTVEAAMEAAAAEVVAGELLPGTGVALDPHAVSVTAMATPPTRVRARVINMSARPSRSPDENPIPSRRPASRPGPDRFVPRRCRRSLGTAKCAFRIQ